MSQVLFILPVTEEMTPGLHTWATGRDASAPAVFDIWGEWTNKEAAVFTPFSFFLAKIEYWRVGKGCDKFVS